MENKPALRQKGRYGLQYRGVECANCGHPLDISDRYCPNCSQANSTKKLTLKDFFDEFFSSLISYDSKLLKTLSALLWRPGKITKDYIDGKRVSYTNPFRFLLSLGIIYFLMVNFGGNYTSFDRYGVEDEKGLFDKLQDLNVYVGNDDEAIEVRQGLDSINTRLNMDSLLRRRRQRDSLIFLNPEEHFNTLKDSSFIVRFFQKQEFFNLLIRKDTIFDFKDISKKHQITASSENVFAFDTAHGLIKLQKQPGSFISSLISKLPFAIFFFLPVFALFIWLAYIRKKYNYTDYLIFSFHNTSLLFILLIISYLIDSLFDVNSNWVFITIFSVYLFVAMRKFYKQGIFKTIVKYIFLNAIFFILALFTILILFTGNVFLY